MRVSDMRTPADAGFITPRANPLSRVVSTIGRENFCRSASQAIGQTIKHDIIGAYVINSRNGMRVVFAEGGVPTNPEFSQIAARRYAAGFCQPRSGRRSSCNDGMKSLTASTARSPMNALGCWNEFRCSRNLARTAFC
jgi:hypothetical protein